MRRNINAVVNGLEDRPETDRVEIDGSMDDVIVRTLVDEMTEDLRTFVEEDLGVEIERTKWVVFGKEVIVR